MGGVGEECWRRQMVGVEFSIFYFRFFFFLEKTKIFWVRDIFGYEVPNLTQKPTVRLLC